MALLCPALGIRGPRLSTSAHPLPRAAGRACGVRVVATASNKEAAKSTEVTADELKQGMGIRWNPFNVSPGPLLLFAFQYAQI